VIGFVLIGLAVGLLLAVGAVQAKVPAPPVPALDALFKKWGEVYRVDWRLLKAHAIRESSLNPNAVNRADNSSYGLAQILCRPNAQGVCTNKRVDELAREGRLQGWPPPRGGVQLLEPDYNVWIQAQLVARNIEDFGMPRAVAVYNMDSQRHAQRNGPFQNQAYVNKVLLYYEELKNV